MIKIKSMLRAHHRAFRNHPFFADTTILYMIENKTGFEHQWVRDHVTATEKLSNCAVLKESDGQIGFTTDHRIKIERAMELKRCFESDRIAICQEVITVNPDPKRNAAAVTETLIKQTENLREFQKVTMTTVQVYITALFNAEFKRISDRTDDAVQALQVIVKSAPEWIARRLEPNQYAYIENLRKNITHVPEAKRMRFGYV